jgi:hypothetical protein
MRDFQMDKDEPQTRLPPEARLMKKLRREVLRSSPQNLHTVEKWLRRVRHRASSRKAAKDQ